MKNANIPKSKTRRSTAKKSVENLRKKPNCKPKSDLAHALYGDLTKAFNIIIEPIDLPEITQIKQSIRSERLARRAQSKSRVVK